jgi:adenylosuccinate lyase
MIERYQDRKIKEIWSRSKRLWIWEVLSLTYLNELLLSKGLIKNRHFLEPFSIVIQKIDRYEQKTKHEFVAFLKELSERLSIFDKVCPEACKYLHYGLTSSDIMDTAFSMQIRMSINEIDSRLKLLQKTAQELTFRTGSILTVGRTHGKHAEEMLFGTRFKSFKIELDHSASLLDSAKKSLYGKFTGPVGTSSHVNEQAANYTLAKWNLLPAPITSQVIPRFYYTDTMYALVTLASALERMATQIRLMAIDEVNEVQEGFSKGQAGSSCMPHKKNPISSEKISGLARLVKSNFAAVLDNNNLWWERDISHSSVERIVWPETFHLISHMLLTMNNVLNDLNINYKKIAENLKNSNADSHEKLLESSLETSRFEAYPEVQINSFENGYYEYNVTKKG